MAELLALLNDQDAATHAAWEAHDKGQHDVGDAFAALAAHLEREAEVMLQRERAACPKLYCGDCVNRRPHAEGGVR